MRRHRGRDRHRTCISQFAEGAPTRAARRRVRARGPLREQRLPSTAGGALLCTLPEAGGKRTYDAMTCALARSIVISPALERVLWRTMLCRVCSADEQRQRHKDRTPTPVTSGDVQEPRRTLGGPDRTHRVRGRASRENTALVSEWLGGRDEASAAEWLPGADDRCNYI